MIVIHVLTLAQEIGVHRNTIRNWVKTGRISAKPGPGKGLQFTPDDFARLCRDFNLDPELLKTMARTLPGAEVPPLATPASPRSPGVRTAPARWWGRSWWWAAASPASRRPWTWPIPAITSTWWRKAPASAAR